MLRNNATSDAPVKRLAMVDIDELQALLAGAFEQKSTVRLSERNVVELVCLCCLPARAPRCSERATCR